MLRFSHSSSQKNTLSRMACHRSEIQVTTNRAASDILPTEKKRVANGRQQPANHVPTFRLLQSPENRPVPKDTSLVEGHLAYRSGVRTTKSFTSAFRVHVKFSRNLAFIHIHATVSVTTKAARDDLHPLDSAGRPSPAGCCMFNMEQHDSAAVQNAIVPRC
jgi:hypothetical protein